MIEAAQTLSLRQANDLAQILTVFPKTRIEADGSPTFVVALEGQSTNAPVDVIISTEGELTFPTECISSLTIEVEQVSRLQGYCDIARQLFDRWIQSPSGRDWVALVDAV